MTTRGVAAGHPAGETGAGDAPLVLEAGGPSAVTLSGAARLAYTAPLLFGSGLCALIYQVAWLREMRFIFGASTAASAAVLAIFMGGLGVGGMLLGRRVDRHPNPLAFYAGLELAIAIVTAATPALVWLAREAYVAVGGAGALGLFGATLARLGLAALVLCVPTILMGGTLPAAARAVEGEDDVGRGNLAVLYGANTFGAVTGAFLATFLLLETFGTSMTLWIACLVNGLVAVVARKLARDRFPSIEASDETPRATAEATRAPAPFVLVAAGIVGFAFFLMELVWYRMLAPLLGGSTYTFGLILAVALLGVGVGGTMYSLRRNERPATLGGFALTCVLEALCIAIPYALGDRLASLALLLRGLSGLGFPGLLLGWTLVSAAVVLPASIIAGIQFPMLIALLGRGSAQVGRHVGLAYACNTVGAIVGSLAGGFGLLPILSATGTWCLVVAVLLSLGLLAAALAARTEGGRALTSFGIAATAATLLFTATGPTAAWRHSPIGAGRMDIEKPTPNKIRQWWHQQRRAVTWSVDGVESAIGIDSTNADAFVVNGKSDGNSRADAPTQVMFPLVAAILHGAPRRALVVGLGTGSSAGWLAAVPSIEHVDVVELEPAIVEMARRSSRVNHDVLTNPKVTLITGDAREVLQTTRERYDLIVSEPSNPYRAGVASLFTQEFYRATAQRLAPGGIFAQFLQAYEVDSTTVRTVLATLSSVFPEVETWQTAHVDLLLLGAAQPIPHDVPTLRQRVAQEPYRTAISATWRAEDVEGFLAHFVARSSLARAIAEQEGDALNTDDRTIVEYAFARSVGRANLFDVDELRTIARNRGENRPELTGEAVDWDAIEDLHYSQMTTLNLSPAFQPHMTTDQRHRVAAARAYVAGAFDRVRAEWIAQPRAPHGSIEVAMLAEAYADGGDEAALALVEQLRALQPIEADVILARLRLRQGRHAEAAELLSRAFESYRTDPWPLLRIMERALGVATDVAAKYPAGAARLGAALSEPFAVHAVDQRRLEARARLFMALDFDGLCVAALAPFEPNIPWTAEMLADRVRCYDHTHHPLFDQASRDVESFFAREPIPFAAGFDAPQEAPVVPSS